MSNYHLQPSEKPQALTPQALRSLRQDPVQGISRRTLLRRSIGGATLLWLTEVTVGLDRLPVAERRGRLRRRVEHRHHRRHQGGQNASLPFGHGLPGLLPERPGRTSS